MATIDRDELLSVEFFVGHVGEHFDVRIEGHDPYRLELTEARGVAGDSDARQPFSLVFRGSDELMLPQRIYRLEHRRLEALEIFLVPLGPEPGGDGALLYEAAFS